MTIGEKIKSLRKSLGLTQTELGERVGVKKNAVSKWECGRVEGIPTSTIKALANLFNVPPSYLIDDEQDEINLNLGERIKIAREAAGLTQSELGVRCGTTKQTIYKYETCKVTNIPFDRLEQIADAVNVSTSELLGWTQNKTPANDTVDGHSEESSMDIEVLNLLRELSPAQLEQAKSYIRFLKQQEDL